MIDSPLMLEEAKAFDYILVKLASICNLKCTYCYWFRDEGVLKKRKIMSSEVVDEFLKKLRAHIEKLKLKSFFVLFHGGEPLLFGKERFIDFVYQLRILERDLRCQLQIGVTTNGLLIDDDWCKIFSYYKVEVTVSVDPTPESHNRNRIDFKGRGSYEASRRALLLLESKGISTGALAVCDPLDDPKAVLNHFVNDLKQKDFDILIPDCHHEDEIPQIASYYKDLYDLWLDKYAPGGVSIRLFKNIVNSFLGGRSTMESIGLGKIVTTTLHTDGALEALDVLRIANHEHTNSGLNIFNNELTDIQHDPLWQEVYQASQNLHPLCRLCRFTKQCGGGVVAHRWSNRNRYENTSAYCGQLYDILSRIEDSIFNQNIKPPKSTNNGVIHEVQH